MANKGIQQVILHDVLGGNAQGIRIGVEVIQNSDNDGITIYDLSDSPSDSPLVTPQRVVVDNYAGKLIVHVWETNAEDPTQSIHLV